MNRTFSKNLCEMTLCSAFVFAILFCMSGDVVAADSPAELKGITAMLQDYHHIDAIHAVIAWTITAKPLTIPVAIDFLAKNDGRFRVKQVYNRKIMPGMDHDIAYDGGQYQVFDRTGLRLTISKTPTPVSYALLLPNVLFEPLQFLGGADNSHPPFNARWKDVMDADRASKCLASAIVDEQTIDNQRHAVILLPGGMISGKAFRYRVFVEGPEGRPNRIDRIAQNGGVITTATFEYGRYSANSATVMLPKQMILTAFDEHGTKVMESDARVSQLDINPTIPEDAFTIDFRDATVVFDNDAKVQIKSASPTSPPN